MHPLTTVIVESACTIANTIKARALFVYADVIQDYPIPSGMLGGTDIILVTHAGSITEPSAEVTSILQLPPIPLTRMAQIKLAVVMGLSAGYVRQDDKIVCLTGIPALGGSIALSCWILAKSVRCSSRRMCPSLPNISRRRSLTQC